MNIIFFGNIAGKEYAIKGINKRSNLSEPTRSRLEAINGGRTSIGLTRILV